MTINTSRREKSTLRKALITITAVAAMCLGSTAMAAAHGGGHAGGFAGGHVGGFGGAGIVAGHGGGAAFAPRAAAPIVNGRVQDRSGNSFVRKTFAWGHGRDHFHHRHFGYGFGGPYYDCGGPYYEHGYDSCCIDNDAQCYADQSESKGAELQMGARGHVRGDRRVITSSRG
jgi:hypothetical protein